MTKRRAESSSLHEVPQNKVKCRSVCDAEHALEAEHALHATSPPALFTTVIGERCRKRSRCCEDHEQRDRTGTPEDRLSNTTHGVNKETGDVSVSVKFRRASGSCTCEMASKKRASESKPEERAKVATLHNVLVTCPDDNEDELCSFNSFQFWRTPLPALDLSLLDSPSTTELSKDSSLKDTTEEMET